MKIGDRVFMSDRGHCGTIEAIDPEPLSDGRLLIDVRNETPDGELSWLVSTVMDSMLVFPVPENLVPAPKSREWRRKSALFCQALERIVRSEFS